MADEKDRSQSDAIDDAMKQIGLTGGSGARAKPPADRVLELFQAALKQGLESSRKPASTESSGADAGAEDSAPAGDVDGYLQSDPTDSERPKAPRKMSEFELGMQATAREAFNDYILANVSKDVPAGSEVAVDGVFIREHGAALFGTMLQALVQSVVPPELNIEVPAKKSAAADAPAGDDSVSADAPAVADGAPASPAAPPQSQVKLTVDFAKLLGDFVAASRARAAAPEDDEADEE